MLANNSTIPIFQQRAYSGKSDPVLITSRMTDPQKRKKPSVIGVQFMGDLWHPEVDWPMVDQVFEACLKAPWHSYIFLTKRIEAAWYYFKSPVYPEHKDGRSRWEYLTHNIVFMTSIENQEMADKRIPILLQIRAKVRGVSVEPMLSYIDISNNLSTYWDDSVAGISWIIAGPETGPRSRPCPEGAIENLYEQCKGVGVPFFDKRKTNWLAREFPK